MAKVLWYYSDRNIIDVSMLDFVLNGKVQLVDVFNYLGIIIDSHSIGFQTWKGEQYWLLETKTCKTFEEIYGPGSSSIAL